MKKPRFQVPADVLDSMAANLPDLAQTMIDAFTPAAKTAIQKTKLEDLTDEEKAAICYFAGAPWHLNQENKVTFGPCGIARINDRWHVFIGS